MGAIQPQSLEQLGGKRVGNEIAGLLWRAPVWKDDTKDSKMSPLNSGNAFNFRRSYAVMSDRDQIEGLGQVWPSYKEVQVRVEQRENVWF